VFDTALEELRGADKVVGVKSLRKALSDRRAKLVFIASDADPALVQPIEALCAQSGVRVEYAATMKLLGTACGISVKAAVAAIV
jgi:large subunit ribosomal protein L7A